MRTTLTFITLLYTGLCGAQFDSTIFGLARGLTNPNDPNSGYIYLAKADPATGVVSNISTTSVAKGFQVINSGIDPYNQIYYFVDLNNQITGLSLISGSIVSQLCPVPAFRKTALVGIAEETGPCSYTLFPQPASDQVEIRFRETANYSAQLFDLQGSLLYTAQSLNMNYIEIPATKQGGLYVLRLYKDQAGLCREKVWVDDK